MVNLNRGLAAPAHTKSRRNTHLGLLSEYATYSNYIRREKERSSARRTFQLDHNDQTFSSVSDKAETVCTPALAPVQKQRTYESLSHTLPLINDRTVHFQNLE